MNVKVYNEDMYEYDFENVDNIFDYIEYNILKKYENEILSRYNLLSIKYEIYAFLDSLIENRLLYDKYYVDLNESGGAVILYKPFSAEKYIRYINFE